MLTPLLVATVYAACYDLYDVVQPLSRSDNNMEPCGALPLAAELRRRARPTLCAVIKSTVRGPAGFFPDDGNWVWHLASTTITSLPHLQSVFNSMYSIIFQAQSQDQTNKWNKFPGVNYTACPLIFKSNAVSAITNLLSR